VSMEARFAQSVGAAALFVLRERSIEKVDSMKDNMKR
jgi:hypothetical protein